MSNEYDPLEELKKGLYESGIEIKESRNGGGYNFAFCGNDVGFKIALIRFMLRYGWKAQDPNWFPGDPAGIGEPAYFIMKEINGSSFSTALDFYSKVMENII